MNQPVLNAAAASSILNSRAPSADKLTVEQARKSAEDFEAVFLSQMLSIMTQELGGVGGVASEGGDVYQDMFTQEIAKMISRSGGIGVADTVLKEMLKTQEID
jgi:Rod binding domain-containing protein